MSKGIEHSHALALEARTYHATAIEALYAGILAIEGCKARLVSDGPQLRARLASALTAYQVFKHSQIFDPAMASDQIAARQLAREMKSRCISAGETYRLHMSVWSFERIAAEWDDYRVAARLISSRLRRHLNGEIESIAEMVCR